MEKSPPSRSHLYPAGRGRECGQVASPAADEARSGVAALCRSVADWGLQLILIMGEDGDGLLSVDLLRVCSHRHSQWDDRGLERGEKMRDSCILNGVGWESHTVTFPLLKE